MIALTGASGFLGQSLLEQYGGEEAFVCLTRKPLPPEGYPGFAADEAAPEKEQSAYRTLEKLCRMHGHPHVCWRQTDYTVESLMQALDSCEGVIHLAARKVDSQTEQTPEVYRENHAVTENLLEACRKKHIRNVVLLSSRCVYSMRDERPFRENRACHPLNFYGLSKLQMEQTGAYYRDHYDMAVKSLRLAQVFGAGDLLSSAPGVFLRRAMDGEPLTLYGTGAGKRNYIYVKDAVRAVMTAYQKTEHSGVYNIGAARSVSCRELAQAAKAVAHSDSKIMYLSDRPDDELIVELDISKACRELGFSASYDLESALQDMKDCLEDRGEGPDAV
ncbi:NAD-dependent epimerase/dehydratase family protein [Candidatus Soleaferrea massiliensis]|uniref:NAD-dependent epimerase/dehydratase family protein n=1 Tax=Candidatus Soleaferrea massiliensis TaxID=1470354 RepID=UPI000694F463|nr:NAD-dependent epimerase/dehydratase family protein [Candidatus Soleaferrea massiliensis]